MSWLPNHYRLSAARRASWLLALATFCFINFASTQAQIQIGTIKGVVSDTNKAVVSGAEVTLENRINGFHRVTQTQDSGEFVFNDVPFNSYTLTISAAGFERTSTAIAIQSNIPRIMEMTLKVPSATASVNVQADNPLITTDSSSSRTVIDQTLVERMPAHDRKLQDVIATTAGWRTENDGLLHIRGVDDGMLYVLDGVPISDRIDTVSGGAFDTDQIRSLEVITGNIAAEFGGRSGAVVAVQSKSMIDRPLNGKFSLNGGNFSAGQFDAAIGGAFHKNFAFYFAASGNQTRRFLDPVDPNNFNNRGGAANLNGRFDWQPTARDLMLVHFVASGTDLHIPNDFDQEVAGQRQRLELRNDSESFRWQRSWSASTVTDVAYFRQSYSSRLIGSAFDTPLFANQDRNDGRQGIIASLTHSVKRHTLKAGFEAQRVSLNEVFQFAVTDIAAALERQISPRALLFGPEHPFVFADQKARNQFSAYAQDSWKIRNDLTLDIGIRYDHTNLLVRDQQFSPRVGLAYHLARTRTAFRASFNRLYMPPQIENLLLASSEQARLLSPFATPAGGGSAAVYPEKSSAYEAGFAQDLFGLFKLDAAYWYRTFRNYDDPNVFFNTPIIFPNSVDKGFARGVDVRIDMPERRGWSGYLSYGNARVLQTGPINGGLFLTDDFLTIGPGVRFIPDHDERNSAAFSLTREFKRSRLFVSLSGRYESGVPLEVDEDQLDDLRHAPGADLVDFERQRVKPWAVANLATGWNAIRNEQVSMRIEFNVQNITNRRFVYNFGNPFSGTHFGYPRLWTGGVTFNFHPDIGNH